MTKTTLALMLILAAAGRTAVQIIDRRVVRGAKDSYLKQLEQEKRE